MIEKIKSPAAGFSAAIVALSAIGYLLSGASTPVDPQAAAPVASKPAVAAVAPVKSTPALVAARISATSCRVSVDKKVCNGRSCIIESSVGSGTHFASQHIVTCAHLFTEYASSDTIVVTLGGKSYNGVLVKQDKRADLALVRVNALAGAGSSYVETWNDAGQFYIAGFGSGDYLLRNAKFDGRNRRILGADTLIFSPINRSGDSGGGVFNSQGQLVAVQWGGVDGQTYATGGHVLVQFLWGAN